MSGAALRCVALLVIPGSGRLGMPERSGAENSATLSFA
jgi:hypothetical protein